MKSTHTIRGSIAMYFSMHLANQPLHTEKILRFATDYIVIPSIEKYPTNFIIEKGIFYTIEDIDIVQYLAQKKTISNLKTRGRVEFLTIHIPNNQNASQKINATLWRKISPQHTMTLGEWIEWYAANSHEPFIIEMMVDAKVYPKIIKVIIISTDLENPKKDKKYILQFNPQTGDLLP